MFTIQIDRKFTRLGIVKKILYYIGKITLNSLKKFKNKL